MRFAFGVWKFEMTEKNYVPALGFHSLTRFYDPLIAMSMRETALKGRLVEQAEIAPRHAVLDVGCGTGTLAMIAKTRHPEARIVGLDGDPEVLGIARRKIERAHLDIELQQGLADDGPTFAPASFDRILTSLLLHHLPADQKLRALKAMRSWLRPDGELHVLDFGPQDGRLLGLLARGVGWLDGVARLRDHWDGRLPDMMRDAGFERARETGRALTIFGSVSFYAAC